MRFQPGKSGNPKGRPPGIKHKRLRYRCEIEEILTKATMATILRRLVEEAIAGSQFATKMCLEYAYGKPVQQMDTQVDIQVNTGEHQLGTMFQLAEPAPKAIESRIVDNEPETPIEEPMDEPNPMGDNI